MKTGGPGRVRKGDRSSRPAKTQAVAAPAPHLQPCARPPWRAPVDLVLHALRFRRHDAELMPVTASVQVVVLGARLVERRAERAAGAVGLQEVAVVGRVAPPCPFRLVVPVEAVAAVLIGT
ncbi:hypothetical protein GCM10009839_14690 [Catenulispora yoronensis]|uniref:Uncharacterized protein n=1 Tax=Catenulispora yoronensis TaxID=450799 RepID=A0ABP5FAR7_9ACTN